MFDIHQSVYDEDGGWDEELSYEYREGLMEAFAESPEGQQYMEANGPVGWTASMLDFAFDYLGVTPTEMSVPNLREILYDLFPRKVSVEPEVAGEIVEELRAFWRFVERQYGLPQSHEFLGNLDKEAEEELRRELSDPSNFGMAKSLFMTGQQAGFDMTSQEDAERFVAAYNASIFAENSLTQLPIKSAPRVSAEDRRAKRKARKKLLKKRKRRRK